MAYEFLPAAVRQHRATLEAAKTELDQTRSDLTAIVEKIASFQAFVPDEAREKISGLMRQVEELAPQIGSQLRMVDEIKSRVQEAKKDKVSPLKVWSYFSAEQKEVRKAVAEVKDELGDAEKALKALKDVSTSAEQTAEGLRKKIAEFEVFDLAAEKARHSALSEAHAARLQRHEAEASTFAALESRYAPQLEQFSRSKSELSKLGQEITSAQGLLEKLSAASDEAQRQDVASKSQKLFNMASPADVLKAKTQRKETLERDVEKIEQLMREALAKVSAPRAVLLEAQDFLYTDGKFIGENGLRAVVEALRRNHKVTVLFDGAARKLLAKDEAGLKALFGPDVAVEIAPSKAGAQALLIELAQKSPETLVLCESAEAALGLPVERFIPFTRRGGRLTSPALGLDVAFEA